MVADCQTCARLRLFLPASLALIAAIYVQPDWATALAVLMPPPLVIGLFLMAANVAGVAWGLWRARAQASAGAAEATRCAALAGGAEGDGTAREEPRNRSAGDLGQAAFRVKSCDANGGQRGGIAQRAA
ncbi:MAG: hypothetical protein AAFQ54_08130 [Pseudomonadota bacterium]